jgi:Ca-activated chloride channel family protein
MRGEGEEQLQAAAAYLFDPAQTSRSLIQWTPQDRIFILPFDSTVRETASGDGSQASQASLLAAVRRQHAGGGTDMYACANQALGVMGPYLDKGYLPAIVIMTDGRSEGGEGFETRWRQAGHEIPVFGVTFGAAEKDQLDHLAGLTRARVFDGGKNLTEAFRSARGYN